jgi:ABC-type dipeptide/oligopeptide/nickel transport system ATPase component
MIESTVINLIGEPCSGKSLAMLAITAEMKRLGLSVEMAPEYAKELTYGNDINKRSYQPVVFGEQAWRIERLRRAGIKYIVTDSPLLLSQIYADDRLPTSFYDSVADLAESYTNIYIQMERRHTYLSIGRTETEEEAMKIRKLVDDVLDYYRIKRILWDGENPREFVLSLLGFPS